jgi:LacI family transcriptional regulator
MALTTKDIATLAGVSQSTVSRALNNSSLISEATRERILKIAREQEFEFNANARGLSTNKSNTIGVIFPDDYMDFGVNLYYGALHTQLRQTLEERDMDLIIAFQENRFTGADAIKRLIIRRKVDGLIIARSQIPAQTLTFLRNSHIPYVFLHFHQDSVNTGAVNQIYSDHYRGGYLATEHLIALGHRRILCVSAHVSEGEDEYEQRRRGYKAALSAHQIPLDEQLILYGDRSFQSGYHLIMQHTNLLSSVTAIFAHTDIMALGIIEALRMHQIRVPEDIAIVGYDDIELSSYFHPYLTTVHQPREEIAVLACERLLQLIETKRSRRGKEIQVQPSLVIRESCGALQMHD